MNDDLTTWGFEISEEMRRRFDPGPLIHVAPNDEVLDIEFDSGWGGSCGPNFTAWTAQRVYFPVVYDGSEWVGSAPRNPCGEACAHVGGQ